MISNETTLWGLAIVVAALVVALALGLGRGLTIKRGDTMIDVKPKEAPPKEPLKPDESAPASQTVTVSQNATITESTVGGGVIAFEQAGRPNNGSPEP